MNLPEIEYGRNTARLDFGDLVVWYSYKTPIAFKLIGHDLVIRVNDWSVTTGKHLNAIDPDKGKRLPGPAFESALEYVVTRFNAAIEKEVGA